jgi:hypothetical protein
MPMPLPLPMPMWSAEKRGGWRCDQWVLDPRMTQGTILWGHFADTGL